MNVSAPLKFGMGASPLRIEDGSLIRGEGRYTTDVTPPGALTAYVLRSTVAHAKIKVGDLSAARSAPGVRLVWTASDVGGLDFMPSLAHGPVKAESMSRRSRCSAVTPCATSAMRSPLSSRTT